MPQAKNPNNQIKRIMLPDDENLLEKKESAELDEPTYTIAEGNLQRHHFASLGTTSKERKRLVSTVEETKTDEKGIVQKSRWKVIGGGEFGLPTWLDKKVLVAVIDAARKASYPVVNPIPINIQEICRQVGFNPESGRNRELIRTSLARISGTTIEAAGAFYYEEQQASINDRFSIFQRVIFANATLEDGTKATRNLVWVSDKILSNINNWYIVPVDTKFFMKLVPIAGRLYEILSNKFFGLFMKLSRSKKPRDGCYIVETYESICQRMPLTIRAHRSRAQGQFAKAHKQLLNAGFLAKVEWLENNNIRYYPGPKAIYDFDNAQRELTRQMDLPFNPRDMEAPREKVILQIEGTKNAPDGQVTLEIVPDGSEQPEGCKPTAEGQPVLLIAALEARGVSQNHAQDLAAENEDKTTTWEGQEYSLVEFYIEYFDWMMKKGGPKKPESGAWLVQAIRAGWMPPKAFKTSKQIAAAATKQAAQEERQREAIRRQQEEEEKRGYFEWLSKTPVERWDAQIFSFQFNYKREHGDKPTPADQQAAKQAYLANPETPEAYQVRNFGQVKYPFKI